MSFKNFELEMCSDEFCLKHALDQRNNIRMDV